MFVTKALTTFSLTLCVSMSALAGGIAGASAEGTIIGQNNTGLSVNNSGPINGNTVDNSQASLGATANVALVSLSGGSAFGAHGSTAFAYQSNSGSVSNTGAISSNTVSNESQGSIGAQANALLIADAGGGLIGGSLTGHAVIQSNSANITNSGLINNNDIRNNSQAVIGATGNTAILKTK